MLQAYLPTCLLHVRLFENKANFQLLNAIFSTEFQNAISIPLWIDWKFNTKHQSASGNKWCRYFSTNHSSPVLPGPPSHPLWALKPGDFPHTSTFLRNLLVRPSAFSALPISWSCGDNFVLLSAPEKRGYTSSTDEPISGWCLCGQWQPGRQSNTTR